jgi:hypothetical protein
MERAEAGEEILVTRRRSPTASRRCSRWTCRSTCEGCTAPTSPSRSPTWSR